MANKIIKPNSILIERIAGELAATWFEAGLNTPGMNMMRKKYRNNPRLFAKRNLEKFIPKAIELMLTMLGPHSTLPPEAKEEIYDCLIDRVNDPSNVTTEDLKGLPDIDVKALLDMSVNPIEKVIDQALKPKREKPLIINTPKPVATRH